MAKIGRRQSDIRDKNIRTREREQLSKKRLAPPALPKPKRERKPGPVTITLALQHQINGVFYGPGETTVPYELAQEFLYREQQHKRVEQQFYGEKAAIIGPRDRVRGHKVMEVSPTTFDTAYEQAEPAVVQKWGQD